VSRFARRVRKEPAQQREVIRIEQVLSKFEICPKAHPLLVSPSRTSLSPASNFPNQSTFSSIFLSPIFLS
jgi:hypothetical protein